MFEFFFLQECFFFVDFSRFSSPKNQKISRSWLFETKARLPKLIHLKDKRDNKKISTRERFAFQLMFLNVFLMNHLDHLPCSISKCVTAPH